MSIEALTAWVLSLLVYAAPPDRYASQRTYPEATETAQERLSRYRDIAADVAAVASSEAKPRREAALLIAVAVFESGLARDVDLGPCSPARIRAGGCDRGRSASLWQLRGYHPATRREAAATALRLIHRSLNACRALPELERLAAYATGRCDSATGQRLSRERLALALRLEARH